MVSVDVLNIFLNNVEIGAIARLSGAIKALPANEQTLPEHAAKAALPEKLIADTLSETLDRFSESWSHTGKDGLEKSIKQTIDQHLKTLPLWGG